MKKNDTANSSDPNKTIFEASGSFIKSSHMHPYLVVFIGPDSGKRYELRPGRMTIGRSSEADIVIEDDRASRIHCILYRNEEHFRIEDQGSTNGTYVNTRKIKRKQVLPGVPIQIGHSLAKIEFKDEAELQFEKKLHHRASIDGLTGIFNRQYFMGRAEEEVSFAQRHHLPLGVIMTDIDHFKRINDTHGHQMGDFVLNRFAGIVSANKRPEDIFARYGGEEFIILPRGGLNQKGVHRYCERLRQTIQTAEFTFGDTRVRMTISLGFHLAPVDTAGRKPTIDHWISKADQALYRAKDLGRNRTEYLV